MLSRFFPILLAVILSRPLVCQEFSIPEIRDLPRVDRSSPRPSRDVLRNSAFILKFKQHAPLGDHYAIITDHTSPEYLEPLKQLAAHRKGSVLKVTDLATIYQKKTLNSLRAQLKELKPRYVAIAPRVESYRENMLLGTWELLSTLDDDRYLDAYPGVLLASSPKSFKALIQRSINYQSISQQKLKPIAISQVPSNTESRSLQKAGILRKVFEGYGLPTPIVAIYTPAANAAPEIKGNQTWKIRLKSKKTFVKTFPPETDDALSQSQLVVMHGHGIPGMSCSVDIDGIPTPSRNQIVLSGSCFAAVPPQSDFPRMNSAPGGYQVSQRQAFATRYIDRGATVFFGHMRLSSGFPHLYPVLEQWIQGASVGEAYQQLINGLMDMRGFGPGRLVVKPSPGQPSRSRPQRIPQNTLLYVIFGDPALRPLEALKTP
ncbi:MAG: hypothetical protein VX438_11110 [Planctomycetota bacterium]|nr:hypothetical protein [Planctomycetota bacterium]